MMYVLLILGFIMLIKGADFFVGGASSIAKRLGISSLIIGLTIVALGTSLPEASVSLTSSIAGNNDIAISNVVGSNIFNLFLILGICSVIVPIKLDKKVITRDFPVSIAAAGVLLILSLSGSLSRLKGLVLFLIFSGYIFILIRSALKDCREKGNCDNDEYCKLLSVPKSIVFTIVGISLVILGGNLVVDNASAIAKSFGLSQNLIGLTIVAAGTSLPELITSLMALKRKDTGIAVGNVIGSNIFNIFFILGGSAMISPLKVPAVSIQDMIILLGGSCLLFLLCFKGRKSSRFTGALFTLLYIGYMIFISIR